MQQGFFLLQILLLAQLTRIYKYIFHSISLHYYTGMHNFYMHSDGLRLL